MPHVLKATYNCAKISSQRGGGDNALQYIGIREAELAWLCRPHLSGDDSHIKSGAEITTGHMNLPKILASATERFPHS